ncbi:HEPN domain-containing protein [Bacillus thuringiensis]
MKAVRQVVEIAYKDESFIGYLNFDEDEKYLEFLVDTVENQIELLKLYSPKTFNCTLHNGKVISCFNCKIIRVKNDNLVRYSIDIYVENDIKRYEELQFNNITAIFPKVNLWFVGSRFSYKSNLDYKGKKLDLIISEGETQKLDSNTKISETYLQVQLKSESLINLEFFNEIYFKISVIFSLLIDKYVSYTYYDVNCEDGRLYKIYQRNQNQTNEVKMTKGNYRINRELNATEFYNIFVAPLTFENFDIWFNYVGVLRTKPLIEEQYLTYARCLEMISRENVNTDIYGNAERRAKSKIYRELIEGMDLDENYKENLIEAFKFSNRKGFKVLLLQLIQNSSFEEQLEMLAEEVDVEKLVSNIVNIRNHLTHGSPFGNIDKSSLSFYTELIKRMVTYFILQRHKIDVPLNIEYLNRNSNELPNPFIK